MTGQLGRIQSGCFPMGRPVVYQGCVRHSPTAEVASQSLLLYAGEKRNWNVLWGLLVQLSKTWMRKQRIKGETFFPTTSIATLHPCWAELTLPDSNPHYWLPHLFSALSTSVKWVLWCFLRRLAVKMNWDTCAVQNPMLCWVGKNPGRGHGNLLQYSRLENPMELVGYSSPGRTESDAIEAI